MNSSMSVEAARCAEPFIAHHAHVRFLPYRGNEINGSKRYIIFFLPFKGQFRTHILTFMISAKMYQETTDTKSIMKNIHYTRYIIRRRHEKTSDRDFAKKNSV